MLCPTWYLIDEQCNRRKTDTVGKCSTNYILKKGSIPFFCLPLLPSCACTELLVPNCSLLGYFKLLPGQWITIGSRKFLHMTYFVLAVIFRVHYIRLVFVTVCIGELPMMNCHRYSLTTTSMHASTRKQSPHWVDRAPPTPSLGSDCCIEIV